MILYAPDCDRRSDFSKADRQRRGRQIDDRPTDPRQSPSVMPMRGRIAHCQQVVVASQGSKNWKAEFPHVALEHMSLMTKQPKKTRYASHGIFDHPIHLSSTCAVKNPLSHGSPLLMTV
jgi:hypothetical protein